MEFTITEQALAEGLAKTLPHAARRDISIVLESIRVDASQDGIITFWATDRYTVARYQFTPVSGVLEVTTPGTVLIPIEQAKTLAKGKGSTPLRIKVENGLISVRGGLNPLHFPEVSGQFPPVEKIFDRWTPATEVAPVLISPIHLAKFNGFKKDPLTFHLGAEGSTIKGSPIKVTGLNDRFEALIQPVSRKP